MKLEIDSIKELIKTRNQYVKQALGGFRIEISDIITTKRQDGNRIEQLLYSLID